jgi:hypothetical protein
MRNAGGSGVLVAGEGRGETPARLARSEETGMSDVRPEIPRSPRFYPIDLPSPPSFHPELGYLLPSPSLWRRLRGVAVTALIGSAIAASTALALMPRPELEAAPREEPLVAALPAPVPVEENAPAALTPRPMSAAALSAHAQKACDDLSTSFLAPECRSGRTGKAAARATRAAHRLTAVTVGRASGEPELEDGGLAQTAPPAPVAAHEEAPAKVTDPAAAAPPKPKPAAKVARKPDRHPDFDAASADPGPPRSNSGGLVFPSGVLPSLFGGDWARSR